MTGARDGDLSRLALLFERHHRALFHFFYRLTGERGRSEDLVQEVFLRILRYRHTYRPQFPFTSWMYQIARNARKDQMPDFTEQPIEEADLPRSAHVLPIAEDRLHRGQQVELLRRAWAELSEEKREVLALSRYQGLNYEEIGLILGCEVNTVKSRVFRAIRSLSEIFHKLEAGRTA